MFRLQILLIFTALILFCSAGIPYRSTKECGVNEYYRENASACRPYCNQDPHELDLEVCNSRSNPGCYCLPGYTREVSDSFNCVPEEDCKFLPKCGPNQIYKVCPNFYIKTCSNLTPTTYDGRCNKGCECKDGFVRVVNSQESDCVPESQCAMYYK
ncbi:mucin-6-like [Onthophagus taurus]|uniref:mucin-6-like n=1 Tax=Onthophagus taurus TaxID=166361 RepID=UPI000C2094A5|nr:inducible metalloproteinase inhibitor protein-like [Onthophagus taurus]